MFKECDTFLFESSLFDNLLYENLHVEPTSTCEAESIALKGAGGDRE
jgi:hypothetical protein